LVNNTNYEAPNYAILSTLLLLHLGPTIPLSTLISNTFNLLFFFGVRRSFTVVQSTQGLYRHKLVT